MGFTFLKQSKNMNGSCKDEMSLHLLRFAHLHMQFNRPLSYCKIALIKETMKLKVREFFNFTLTSFPTAHFLPSIRLPVMKISPASPSSPPHLLIPQANSPPEDITCHIMSGKSPSSTLALLMKTNESLAPYAIEKRIKEK